MLLGIFYALIAGLMWGIVFVAPLLLPDYPPALLAVGRYLAFGLIALPLAWISRAGLRQLTRATGAKPSNSLRLAISCTTFASPPPSSARAARCRR